MGYYINQINGKHLPALGKAEAILASVPKSQQINQPKSFCDDLVCVVNNGTFQAAGYCYNKSEFECFSENDGRSKIWLIVPGAKELAK